LPKGIGRVVEGEILFDGKDMRRLSDRELLSLHGHDMAMIFQEPMTSLNPVYTIGYQLSEVLRYHMGMSRKAAMEKSISLLRDVGISRPEMIVKNYPHELSGGMLQRVMIAMGLSCNPKLLIADEPTTALDVTIQAQILDLMMKLKEEHNTAILMITHNMGVVAEVCDRVIVMYAGYVVETAEVTELFDHPSHPYTQSLLRCIPKIDEDREVLDTIEGTVPPPYAMPKGCRFGPRCPYAQPICSEEKPELYDVGSGHTCRCFRYKEGHSHA
jgi:oligopeptide/dipeptide ABC transporter ATP-binding protein